ncbi:polyhydroxyalkanoate synthesis repressor PhaR [Amphiplicatus metriothermophilus]|uniref:Polyhydroxyalkanoate synthesis repressor PhaR n=1 Tax=Amphiplicatus metriothermophilus TaxID=1519374 RepID=A0A239PIW0_9PROT|nr:polyhydroxyalkanoate synthesis repressor PhaR [Amphiplicatus metriothermophilus]MBB5517926.1 polyhydroxyalkanoate synthesis repressor PhaR [Amphiplicatus metriothermophilus]SNT67741.1 polyhydroxyalkanoate synthesis repressor PhaR [Amphiplicatus metriothermophilus]
MSEPQNKREQTDPSAGAKGAEGEAPIVVKKYANRRLYNTATSSYVTLDYLADMVKNGQEFVVYDAKTGENITRSVLTQIIVEEESKGRNLLPIQFLRQLIQFYGDSLQTFLPSYLEMSMDAFARNQEKLRAHMRDTFGAAPGYQMFEETARQNMAMFEQAMKMFSPMSGLYQQAMNRGAGGGAESEEIRELKSQLAALQRQLDKLEKKG